MKELVKVSQQYGRQTVSARTLYEFLEVGADFTNWCKRMFEYGFEEDLDFTPILAKSTGGRPGVDYALTLDCAKEISMLQRNEKGKIARRYFIEVEKNAKKELSPAEQLLKNAQILVEQERTLQEHDQRILELEAKTKAMPDYFTVAGFGSLNGVHVNIKTASILGRAASRLCKERGLPTDDCPDPRFGKVKMYPKTVLVEVFKMPLNN